MKFSFDKDCCLKVSEAFDCEYCIFGSFGWWTTFCSRQYNTWGAVQYRLRIVFSFLSLMNTKNCN